MNLERIVRRLDAETARAFVQAARHVIDALLIEAERVQQMQTPAPVDYNRAELRRDTPAGGWLSHAEVRQTARRLAEAVAAERWCDGALFVLRLFGRLGGGS